MSKINSHNIRTATPEQLKQASQELRAESAENQRLKEESFQRSDTDGFLSQWAHGLTSQEKDSQVRILENGGKCEFTGLYEGDRRVKAKEVRFKCSFTGSTKYSWVLHEDEKELIARRGKKYLPTGEKSSVLRKLGLQERREIDWAWAKLDGQGTGLSGTCWVARFRVGDEWGGEAVLAAVNQEAIAA